MTDTITLVNTATGSQEVVVNTGSDLAEKFRTGGYVASKSKNNGVAAEVQRYSANAGVRVTPLTCG